MQLPLGLFADSMVSYVWLYGSANFNYVRTISVIIITV